MGFLNGKRALITGVASQRSIAFSIAKAFQQQGAELAFTYQGEKLQSRVEKIALELGSSLVFPCDVAQDEDIQNLFANLSQYWPKLDILVHSIAYAPTDQISGDFVMTTTRDGFRIAHDISVYSLIALAKAAVPMMQDTQGAMITLSYYGAEKAIPNYNVMGLAKASLEAGVRYLAMSLGINGIRVNAISAGPIKTLAAAAIKDFRKIHNVYAQTTPLKRNITAEEVGNAAAFLCSDLASGITAEVVHVDAGYHAVSLSADVE